jgi:hypothetical protein
MPKLKYCWRTTPPKALSGAAQFLQAAIRSTLRSIIMGGGPGLRTFYYQLASLPLRYGGLGIHDPMDHILFYI